MKLVCDCFKNSTSIILQQCDNYVNFDQMVLAFHPNFFDNCQRVKGVALRIKHITYPFQNVKNPNTSPKPFLSKVASFWHCRRTEVLLLEQLLFWLWCARNQQPLAWLAKAKGLKLYVEAYPMPLYEKRDNRTYVSFLHSNHTKGTQFSWDTLYK